MGDKLTTNDNGPSATFSTNPRFGTSSSPERHAALAARVRRFARFLTGMGSSLHALHPLNQRLAARLQPVMAETSGCCTACGLLTGETLLVAVRSQDSAGNGNC
jgi:hypothetical protein